MTERWSASGHTINTRVWGVLTGASGHPVEAHNSSFFSPYYKYSLHSCVWDFCSFQQVRNTFESAKKSKVLVR